MSVYTLENLLWKDVENKIVTLAKHTIGGVPVKLAEKAIALGLADASTSPRAQKLIAANGMSARLPALYPADMKRCGVPVDLLPPQVADL
jgi:hypothetical protein